MTESKQFKIKDVSVTLENKSYHNGPNPAEDFTINCDNPEVLREIIEELKRRGTLHFNMDSDTKMITKADSIRVSHDTIPFVTFKRAAEVLAILERQSRGAGRNQSFALAERQRVANPAWDLAEMALECLKDTGVNLTPTEKRKFRAAFMEKCHSNVPGL